MEPTNNEEDEVLGTKPHPQTIKLVKPPKKLNEMTEEELRAWARSLGNAFKKNAAEQQHEEGKK